MLTTNEKWDGFDDLPDKIAKATNDAFAEALDKKIRAAGIIGVRVSVRKQSDGKLAAFLSGPDDLVKKAAEIIHRE